MYLYSGEGVGGTELASIGYTGNGVVGWNDFYFNDFIPVTAGNQYTIAISIGSTGQTTWGNYEASNSYSGGRSDRNAAHDRMFKTYYTTARGAINTSAGTTSKKIGLALSTTEVLILNT